MSFEVDREVARTLLVETGISKAAKNLNDVRLMAKLSELAESEELEDLECQDKEAKKVLKAIQKDASILDDLEIIGDAETNGHAAKKSKKAKEEEVAEEGDSEEASADDEENETDEEEDAAEEEEEEVAEEDEEKPAKKGKKTKKETKVKKASKKAAKRQDMSCLDAAAKVLAESKKPMRCTDMIERMSSKGYWTSPGGATPAATLYSSIIREIDKKGKESRFRKTDKGQFAAPGAKTKK